MSRVSRCGRRIRPINFKNGVGENLGIFMREFDLGKWISTHEEEDNGLEPRYIVTETLLEEYRMQPGRWLDGVTYDTQRDNKSISKNITKKMWALAVKKAETETENITAERKKKARKEEVESVSFEDVKTLLEVNPTILFNFGSSGGLRGDTTYRVWCQKKVTYEFVNISGFIVSMIRELEPKFGSYYFLDYYNSDFSVGINAGIFETRVIHEGVIDFFKRYWELKKERLPRGFHLTFL